MVNDENIVEILNGQVERLFIRIQTLEQLNTSLTENYNTIQLSNASYQEELKTLKIKHDALKTANSFLGSEENKKEAKLKINALIKEINYCIAQLST